MVRNLVCWLVLNFWGGSYVSKALVLRELRPEGW